MFYLKKEINKKITSLYIPWFSCLTTTFKQLFTRRKIFINKKIERHNSNINPKNTRIHPPLLVDKNEFPLTWRRQFCLLFKN